MALKSINQNRSINFPGILCFVSFFVFCCCLFICLLPAVFLSFLFYFNHNCFYHFYRYGSRLHGEQLGSLERMLKNVWFWKTRETSPCDPTKKEPGTYLSETERGRTLWQYAQLQMESFSIFPMADATKFAFSSVQTTLKKSE